jgi:hypothetical protein
MQMNNEIEVLKDENKQQRIPSKWRPTLAEIVEAFKEGDFQLNRNVAGVRPLPATDAERIAGNLKSFGAHLVSLPTSAWDTSACQWMQSYWDALVDLYTAEEGASDLALFVRVFETAQGYEFLVQSVHVP